MDGDVAAGLMAAMEHRTGIDVLMGIGGAPEAVLAACGIKCIGGGMQARIWVGEGERSVQEREGKHAGDVLELDDLVSGDNVFFAATGITSGELLEGVRFLGEDRCHTQSLVMRCVLGDRSLHRRRAQPGEVAPPPRPGRARVEGRGPPDSRRLRTRSGSRARSSRSARIGARYEGTNPPEREPDALVHAGASRQTLVAPAVRGDRDDQPRGGLHPARPLQRVHPSSPRGWGTSPSSSCRVSSVRCSSPSRASGSSP